MIVNVMDRDPALRVLITFGGTREQLDGVRSVTNTSTGRTGAEIAARFLALGVNVFLLYGKGSVLPSIAGEGHERLLGHEEFTSFRDLDSRIQRILQNHPEFDAVIHLAAVSDFSPVSIETDSGLVCEPGTVGKLSSQEGFTVRFEPNHKIIDRLRRYGAVEGRIKPLTIVGYKLTNTADSSEQLAAVRGIADRRVCDLIVHNDLGQIDSENHPAMYYDAECRLIGATQTKREMADWLYRFCKMRREEI